MAVGCTCCCCCCALAELMSGVLGDRCSLAAGAGSVEEAVALAAGSGATALRNASPLMADFLTLKGEVLMGAGAEAAALSAAVAAARLAAEVLVPDGA